MLVSIAGWSVLDDVANTTSVTFVTLLFVLPVCAAASIAAIATREAGTAAADSQFSSVLCPNLKEWCGSLLCGMLQSTAPARRCELLCDCGLEKGCTQRQ